MRFSMLLILAAVTLTTSATATMASILAAAAPIVPEPSYLAPIGVAALLLIRRRTR